MPRYARVAVPAPLYPLPTLLDYEIPEDLNVQVGSLVDIPFGHRETSGLVLEITTQCSFDPKKIKKVNGLRFPEPIFSEKRLEFLRELSATYLYPIGLVCESAIPGPVRDAKKLVLKEKKSTEVEAILGEIKKLNDHQQRAVESVLKGGRQTHLLWGVTGSGKTEVYLEIIEHFLQQGKSALVLVPEISLTPQVTRRFQARFGTEIAVFHSAQKASELKQAWLETFYGKKRIAIGARSALFAPLKDLGVILVDEEHDGSYKQEERLRYNARDAAVRMAEIFGLPCVLGSATPSAETLYKVEKKIFALSMLPDRAVGQAQLPQIRRVDLKKQMAEATRAIPPAPRDPEDEGTEVPEAPSIRGDFFLSPELRVALDECLNDSKQAILFLNRRGIGSQILCRDCGFVFDCPSCDVRLTPHRAKLVCHYCGFEQKVPKVCPSCERAEEPFVHVGIGTAAVEEALHFHFPKARVLRMDRDSTETRGSLEQIVADFSQKKADILVGTQMVAKGHDFPDVSLVGILLAELGLAVPDFRATERNFQLLLQVSGRAGRALVPGKVIVQSFQPEHPVLEALENFRGLEDYRTFLNAEIARREMLLYPPYGRLFLLKFDGLDAGLVSEAAQSVAAALKKVDPSKLHVLGPVPSPLAKIRGRYRWQILLKSSNPKILERAVAWILEGWESKKMERSLKTRLIVDVDPMQML